jgi:hypothetical protein
MTTSEWHLDEALWAAYAQGRLDSVAESSVEAHVTGCATCRTSARGHVEPAELERVWTEVELEVQRPRPAAPLRWLSRIGVPEQDVAVLAASDGLAVAWSVAIGGALTCLAASSLVPRYQDFAFLLLAPLVPLLAVAAAYDATDVLRELTAPTPYSKLRLALLRTTSTLAVALPVTLTVGLVIPGLEDLAFVWLLPGLGMSLAALVLMAWLPPWSAATGVAAAWALACSALLRAGELSQLDRGTVQAAFALGAALMAGLLVVRTTTLRVPGGRS